MAKVSASDVRDGAKSFFGSLFDFSFSEFITVKLVSFLFGAGIVIGAISGVAAIVGAFSRGVGAGFLSLLITPVFYFLGIIVLRIWLEIVIVLFKIETNTR